MRPSEPKAIQAKGAGGGPRSSRAQRTMRRRSASLRRATKPAITATSSLPATSAEAISATLAP